MIGLERDGGVLTVRIQRPERRNALNAAVIDELRATFEGAAAEGVKAIVLTGAGSVFCSGMDLSGRRPRRRRTSSMN